MDLRVTKTKQNINKAFMVILSKKPFEKITIKELSNLACINKSTFYLHYKDIYDLRESVEDEFVALCVNEISDSNILTEETIIKTATFLASRFETFTVLFPISRLHIFQEKYIASVKNFIFTKYPTQKNNYCLNYFISLILSGSIFAFYKCYNSEHLDELINSEMNFFQIKL